MNHPYALRTPHRTPLTSRRSLLLSATALALLGRPAQAAEPLPVTASFSILGDLVRVVGSSRIAVTTLVGPDQDAHVFEPRPADAKALLASNLLVVNGLGFEPWAARLVKSAGYKGETVVATSGVKARQTPKANHGQAHAEADPHAWQNPENVVLYVRNIALGLSKVDPTGASKAQFATLSQAKRKAITSHDAFGYLAAHYGLTFLAPQGVNTDTEPSARQVGQLIRQIQREKIRAVFVENMGNPKLLAQLSQDAGVTPGASLYADALSSADKPGATYLQMMRHNVTQLVVGMQLN